MNEKIINLEQELCSSRVQLARLEVYNTSYEERVKTLEDELQVTQQKWQMLESLLESSQDKLDQQQRELLDAYRLASHLIVLPFGGNLDRKGNPSLLLFNSKRSNISIGSDKAG